MAFTKEIIDFSELSADEVQKKLTELNIPLTVQEALKIQNEMLGRAPSLAELVLFSIQGSEHCSYKSSRKHLKQFTTEGPDVVLGAKEDAGVVAIAKDGDGHRAIRRSSNRCWRQCSRCNVHGSRGNCLYRLVPVRRNKKQ